MNGLQQIIAANERAANQPPVNSTPHCSIRARRTFGGDVTGLVLTAPGGDGLYSVDLNDTDQATDFDKACKTHSHTLSSITDIDNEPSQEDIDKVVYSYIRG